MVFNMEKETQLIKYNIGVWVIFWIVMGLSFFLNLISGIIHIVVFFILKTNFETWVKEQNNNPNYPFLLVLFFGLFGHIAYYIYCRSSLK